MTDIDSLSNQALADIDAANTPDALESLRVRLLGKQGAITSQLKTLGALPPDPPISARPLARRSTACAMP